MFNKFLIVYDELKLYMDDEGTEEEVFVPEGVKSIAKEAFWRKDRIKRIVLPEGVQVIMQGAFSECRSLESIVLPKTLKSIGPEAFFGCSSLKEIVLPDSVEKIDAEVFKECTSLSSVVLPEGINKISDSLFCCCPKLTSVDFPSSIEEIGDDAFFDCRKLQNVHFAEGLKSIGDHAFAGCRDCKSFVFPSTLEYIGREAFASCSARMEFAEGCTFEDLRPLVKESSDCFIVYPSLPFERIKDPVLKKKLCIGFIRNIEKYSEENRQEYYKYIARLKKEYLPIIAENDCVPIVRFFAESGKITIRNFEEEFLLPLEEGHATECSAYLLDWKRTHITAEDQDKFCERELSKDPFNVYDMKQLWRYEKLPDNTVEILGYKGEREEIDIPIRIGKYPVSTIGESAFSNRFRGFYSRKLNDAKTVFLPDSVTVIREHAFSHMSSLRSVRLPDTLTTLDKFAFFKCVGLQYIHLPKGIKKVESSCFHGCENLTEVVLEDGIESLGAFAFSECFSLKKIIVPPSVSDIGLYCFNGCNDLCIYAKAGSFAEKYAREYHLRVSVTEE